ncbi:MAG: hypothetical protein Q4P14_01030 [Methanobacteriaceae archaeon]|nr:hypothetical protein [Methanobacteriaceae archaeon]
MVRKVFVTDCEGPLTLDDNAFELSANFVEDGDKLFKIISAFDDYLVDIVKKDNYNAGDTLKLIVPFFKLAGLRNKDLIEYSKNHINTVPGINYIFDVNDKSLESFIISTSYGQYIEALCDYINFPFKNTYFTSLHMYQAIENLESELKRVEEFRKIILEHGSGSEFDNNVLYKIFFEEFPKMEIVKHINSVKTVGGKGKEIALRDIVKKCDLVGDKNAIMYVGDSITDVEPLRFASESEGIAISFNGNDYAINAADIAVISDNAIMTAILRDLFIKTDRETILKFAKEYFEKGPESAFNYFEVDSNLVNEFEKLYQGKNIPVMDVITEENKEYLTKLSKKMRVEIRGKDIGGLG